LTSDQIYVRLICILCVCYSVGYNWRRRHEQSVSLSECGQWKAGIASTTLNKVDDRATFHCTAYVI